MFPPEKSGREIWGIEIFRFPGNLRRDPGNFFFILRVSVVLISIIPTQKCVHVKLKKFFYSLKIIFQNFLNFLRPNVWEIKKFFLNSLKNVKNLNSVCQNSIKKCLKLDWKC